MATSRVRAGAPRVGPPEPMRATTIRFSDAGWDAIREEADRVGVSIGQYVREATYARTLLDRHDRGDESVRATIDAARGDSVR